jgi:hypothetical protein
MPPASSGNAQALPTFGNAPDLLGAESRTCDLSEFVTDNDAFVAAFGKTVEEIAADIDLVYDTVLRWDTVVPPFSGLGEQESLAISLSYDGVARLYPRCQNLVDIDVNLVVRSQSGALAFDGPATVAYTRPERYRLRATLPPSVMDEWMKELQSVTLQEPSAFEVDLDLSQGGAGHFLVHGGGGATCHLATWPSQRVCELGEIAVLPDGTHLGLRPQDVAVEADKLDGTFRVVWEDTLVEAQMTVDFVPDASGPACVLPDVGAGIDGVEQVMYSVPGNVHILTDDNRMDVTVPTRARTRGREGAWSTVDLLTDPVVASERGFGIVPASLRNPRERAVLSFSSPREPITPQSQRIRGGFEMQIVDLQSERANPKTSSCIAANFMGVVSELVASASYVSGQP